MTEQIAVITTGGTIGSVISGEAVSVDPSGLIVHEEISKICRRRNLDVSVTAALNKHSEDLSVADWSMIAGAIKEKLDSGVKRIVVTHGTDTLAYSAAACGLLFAREDARICLTGSFHSLEEPNSDGPLNLIAAFRAVSSDELPNGVYVSFRATERNTQASIIPALLLKPMMFDGLCFEGVYGDRVAGYGPKSGFDLESIARPFHMPSLAARVPEGGAISNAASKIVQVIAYPGLNLGLLRTENLSAMIVSLYHSGTAYSLAEDGAFLDFLGKKPQSLPVFFATFPTRYIHKPYESTVRLARSGGVVICDLQPHVIFSYLTLAIAQGVKLQDIEHALTPWTLKL